MSEINQSRPHEGPQHTGGCECGAVRYAVSGKISSVVYCHCGQCRRLTGYALAASTAPQDAFHFTNDEGLRWYASSGFAERGFCNRCGAQMFYRTLNGTGISFTAGSLDHGEAVTAAGHIFIADKAPWQDICDGLPQWPQDDDGSPDALIHDPIQTNT